MLLSGDEVSHTQHGNNNTYCQDNELTWLNWEFSEEQQDLLRLSKRSSRPARNIPYSKAAILPTASRCAQRHAGNHLVGAIRPRDVR